VPAEESVEGLRPGQVCGDGRRGRLITSARAPRESRRRRRICASAARADWKMNMPMIANIKPRNSSPGPFRAVRLLRTLAPSARGNHARAVELFVLRHQVKVLSRGVPPSPFVGGTGYCSQQRAGSCPGLAYRDI
jgi:hypothetical protein